MLLHGITSTSDAWREVMPKLAERYTVIAPDMIGHGRSAKPRGDYSLGAYAAGVRDLLAVLGFERGTVVGHSLGGGIAMQLAYLFPEYVERMALISSGGLGKEVHALLRAATLPGSEWVLPLLAREWSVRAGDAVRSVAAKLGRAPGPDLAEFARGYASLVHEGARDAFLDTMRSVIGPEGQKVSALDRLYLADQTPLSADLGRRGSGDPGRARPARPRACRPQPLRRDRGLGPLADARRPRADRRRADRLHRGDRAVRVVAGAGARAYAAWPGGFRWRRRLIDKPERVVPMAFADRSVELSDQVLEEIKEGQEAAIKAVRNFTETVDKTLAKESSPTQAEEIVDSALKMADKLVETQYTFLKKVVHSAGESLGVEESSEKK